MSTLSIFGSCHIKVVLFYVFFFYWTFISVSSWKINGQHIIVNYRTDSQMKNWSEVANPLEIIIQSFTYWYLLMKYHLMYRCDNLVFQPFFLTEVVCIQIVVFWKTLTHLSYRIGDKDYDYKSHYDVIKWTHFPHYCRFVREIHKWPVDSSHKGRVAWTFVSLLSACTNS